MNIKINKNIIFSYRNPPIIIAEISGNHNGKRKKFMELIKKAYDSGADMVKIQSYEPKDITLNLTTKLNTFNFIKEYLENRGIKYNTYEDNSCVAELVKVSVKDVTIQFVNEKPLLKNFHQ